MPIEIIKKEIVHVPLYTNDKSLLTLAMNEKFDPKDIDQPEPGDESEPKDNKPNA